jgi:hypothetical protein
MASSSNSRCVSRSPARSFRAATIRVRAGRVVLLPQRLRAVFNLVEQMRYPPVIGLQLVYHRAKLRIRAPDAGKSVASSILWCVCTTRQ